MREAVPRRGAPSPDEASRVVEQHQRPIWLGDLPCGQVVRGQAVVLALEVLLGDEGQVLLELGEQLAELALRTADL